MSMRSSRRRVAFSALGAVFAGLVVVASALVLLSKDEPLPARTVVQAQEPERVTSSLLLTEDFREPLDPTQWTSFVQGTPAAWSASPGPAGLMLGLDTRRSDPRVVCATGVASAPLAVGAGLRIRARLDWRAPENACYRTAGLRVVPAEADPASLERAAWLELVGAPPGGRARRFAAVRTGSHPVPVFVDGWPAAREGRVVGVTTLELVVTASEVAFTADGEGLGRAALDLGAQVRVVLYTTSHANYAARPVTFEELLVEHAVGAQRAAPEIVATADRGRP